MPFRGAHRQPPHPSRVSALPSHKSVKAIAAVGGRMEAPEHSEDEPAQPALRSSPPSARLRQCSRREGCRSIRHTRIRGAHRQPTASVARERVPTRSRESSRATVGGRMWESERSESTVSKVRLPLHKTFSHETIFTAPNALKVMPGGAFRTVDHHIRTHCTVRRGTFLVRATLPDPADNHYFAHPGK